MKKHTLSVSNQFINARYNYSALEIDIMLHIIARLDEKQPNQTEVIMWAKELLPQSDHSHAMYQYIKDACEDLLKKPFQIFNGKSYWLTNFISTAEIETGTGKITVTISPIMRNIVMDVRREFTVANLKNLLNLDGKHSKRLYMLACQFVKSGNRTIEIEELKTTLLLQDQYSELKDFIRWVVKPALEEINKKTELVVVNTYLKLGRRINALSLDISLKDVSHSVNYGSVISDEALKQRAELRTRLSGFGLSSWQVENVITILDPKSINQVIYKMTVNKTTVMNKPAYLWKSFVGMGVPATAIPKQYNLEDMIDEVEAVQQSKTPTLS